MARYRVWATTTMGFHRDEAHRFVTILDEDLEGMDDEEIWEVYLKEHAEQLCETGYEKVEAGPQ